MAVGTLKMANSKFKLQAAMKSKKKQAATLKVQNAKIKKTLKVE